MAATPVPARMHRPSASDAGAKPNAEISVDLIAITRDDLLLERVGQELDGQTGIRLADSVDAAREHVRATHAQVFLLDARDRVDLSGAVDQLQSFSESGVVVVFAPESQSPEIASAIKRTAVFAVLPIPVEPGKTAAVLGGAREEALSRATLAAPPAVPAPLAKHSVDLSPDVVEPWGEAAATAPPARPRTPKRLIPGVLGLLVLGSAAAWFLLDRPAQHAEPEAAPAADLTDAKAVADPAAGPGVAVTQGPEQVPARSMPERVVGGSVEVLLDKAATAFRDRRFVEPEADSALLYYRSVLAQAPDNGEARQGLERIFAVLEQRLQSAVAERRFDDAAAVISQLSLVRPGDPGLRAAEALIAEGQVSAALDAGRTDRAGELLRRASQARVLPADRTTYWRDEIGRRQRAQQAAMAQKSTAEAARSSTESRASVVPPAASQTAAIRAPVSGDQVAAQRPLSEPQHQPAAQSTAAEPAHVEAIAPRPVVAAQPSPVSPTPAPAPIESASLERTYFVPPAYPKGAEKEGVSGEVRVRLTVGPNGRVKAAEVVSSTPAGVFDQAVMAAVVRWRFKAPQVDGRAVEARTVVSVVFKPAEGAR